MSGFSRGGPDSLKKEWKSCLCFYEYLLPKQTISGLLQKEAFSERMTSCSVLSRCMWKRGWKQMVGDRHKLWGDSSMSSCTATDASRCTCCSMGLAKSFEMYLLQPGVILWGVTTGHSPLAQAPTGAAASSAQQQSSPELGPASPAMSSSLLLSEHSQAQQSSLISTMGSTESKSCPWRPPGTPCSQDGGRGSTG